MMEGKTWVLYISGNDKTRVSEFALCIQYLSGCLQIEQQRETNEIVWEACVKISKEFTPT